MLNLKNTGVIITGAGSGLEKTISLAFSRTGPLAVSLTLMKIHFVALTMTLEGLVLETCQ